MANLRRTLNDVSRCDFAAASHLAEAGYDPATIRAAMREASPDLAERKPGHVEDYVRRTVDVAVRLHLEDQARARERERDGPER